MVPKRKEPMMELLNVEFWEVALNAAVLVLCGITVMYIIGRKGLFKKEPAPRFSDEIISSIAQKTFYNLMRQQTGNSFPNTAQPEKVPRTPPSGRSRHQPSRKTAKKNGPAVSRSSKEGIYHIKSSPSASGVDSKSLKIYEFHSSGMSVEKISEKLSIPRCEVELFTKFHDRSGKANEELWV